MREKNKFAEPEKLFFCKAKFHPVRQYKGSRQKHEPLKGIANPFKKEEHLDFPFPFKIEEHLDFPFPFKIEEHLDFPFPL